MTDFLAELRTMSERIRQLPKPVAYIVLDHSVSGNEGIEGEDKHGRRYVRFSPALLDAVAHRKGGPTDLAAIPLHRREDMPEGWPDA